MSGRGDDTGHAEAAAGSRVAGVVLAGGASRRMGRPKAGLLLEGRTFLAHAIATQRAAGIATIVVVAGADRGAVEAAMPASASAVLLDNPAPERGQLSSLKVALAHLLGDPAVTAALVALIDHPGVTAATLGRILAAARSAHHAAIVLPTHAGRRGHPVLFARAVWRELLATPDELGARAVVRSDPRRVLEVAVDDPGVLLDVDTPSDLQRLRAGTPRGTP